MAKAQREEALCRKYWVTEGARQGGGSRKCDCFVQDGWKGAGQEAGRAGKGLVLLSRQAMVVAKQGCDLKDGEEKTYLKAVTELEWAGLGGGEGG